MESLVVQLPAAAIVRLDQIADVEGPGRAEVASRLLVKALADLETREMLRQERYSLLDTDEDLVGP